MGPFDPWGRVWVVTCTVCSWLLFVIGGLADHKFAGFLRDVFSLGVAVVLDRLSCL